MKTTLTANPLLSGLAALGALGALTLLLGAANPPAKVSVQNTPVARESRGLTGYSQVVKRAAPGVVNIYSTKYARDERRASPLMDPFFRYFYGPGEDDDEGDGQGGSASGRQQQSLGSGVIVTDDGYILTNNHVVQGADEIRVLLSDNRTQFEARLVGTDPHTDIAVLKIEAKGLKAIPLTDSDKLDVGDAVVAIGNPFGLGQTVTAGIVSAKGRSGFGVVDYEDFIQTDASINPGNSGGALVDAEGRLVGINTFIISRSGGSQGVGFAVPINLARQVMSRIVADGRVVRGFLGITLQTLTPELALAFGLPRETAGALVSYVVPRSPAAEAGLRDGDVIVEFDGKQVSDDRQLRLQISQTTPGKTPSVKLMRDGKDKTVEVRLAELPERRPAAKPAATGARKATWQTALDGIVVDDLDPRTRRQLGLPAGLQGALIVEVRPGTPASSAGLAPGAVLVEINQQPVRNAQDAVTLSRNAKGARVLLRVFGGGGVQYVVVEGTRRRTP